VKTILALLFAAVLLVSCQTSRVVKDVHMRSDTAFGPDVLAYLDLFMSLNAQPYYSTTVGYGFKTLYTGQGKSHLSQAWSYGRQMRFERGVSRRAACFFRPCLPTREETGVVAMDEADFVAAATKGLDFELAGKAGKIVGRIPAHAFRRVLDLKSSMKLPSTAANSAPPAKAQAPADEDTNIDDD